MENGDAETVGATVSVGVFDRPDALPEEWHEAKSGEPIPGLADGADLADAFVWVRQELTATDPAVQPRMLDLALEAR